MYQNKKVLAIIPARGGSKGVPRKNIRDLAGKPLIAWTIETANNSRYIDRLILSSDDSEIIEVAKKFGCDVPFIRPPELSDCNTPGIATLFHAIDSLNESYDVIVLLQPTSPLRTAEDIDNTIECCVNSQYGSSVSVTESSKHPAWMFSLSEDGGLESVWNNEMPLSRQEMKAVYVLNGAVYAILKPLLLDERKLVIPGKTVAYVMPGDRSVDIDTVLDFSIAETLILQRDKDVQ